MPRYRICKNFTVESGHMLSKHPEKCRYPHGHTRTIEVVVGCETLDSNDMVVDFKAVKNLAQAHIDRYDHRMAMNSNDPLRSAIEAVHPDSVIIFENTDPTTEVIAKSMFDYISTELAREFSNRELVLERVRVWETPTSWAEYRI